MGFGEVERGSSVCRDEEAVDTDEAMTEERWCRDASASYRNRSFRKRRIAADSPRGRILILCKVIRRFICLRLSAAGSLATSQELKLPETPKTLHVVPATSDRFPAKWHPKIGEGTDVFPAPVIHKPYKATAEEVTPYRSPSGEPLRHTTRGFEACDRFGRPLQPHRPLLQRSLASTPRSRNSLHKPSSAGIVGTLYNY